MFCSSHAPECVCVCVCVYCSGVAGEPISCVIWQDVFDMIGKQKETSFNLSSKHVCQQYKAQS